MKCFAINKVRYLEGFANLGFSSIRINSGIPHVQIAIHEFYAKDEVSNLR